MKKQFFYFFPVLVAVCAGLFVSCKDLKDVFSSGIDFTKPGEVAQLNELLNKHITEDLVVQEIKFSFSGSSSSFSNCKDGATIIYVDPANNTVLHGTEVNLKTGDFGPDQWLEDHPRASSHAQKGVQLKEFDFSKISTIVNDAVQVLKDQDIQTNGIGSFSINFDSGKADDYVYVFDLQHRTGSTQQGRTTRVSYDEYSFKADQDGNLLEK